MPEEGHSCIRRLLSRAVNRNQLLILSRIGQRNHTLTSLLNELSCEESIPLSTLKLHSRELRELGLIAVASTPKSNYNAVEITENGRLILSLLGCHDDN